MFNIFFKSDVTDQLNALPRGDEFALQFVTWPGLEEALKGVRDEMGNLPTITKIYQEHSFQTDDVVSGLRYGLENLVDCLNMTVLMVIIIVFYLLIYLLCRAFMLF